MTAAAAGTGLLVFGVVLSTDAPPSAPVSVGTVPGAAAPRTTDRAVVDDPAPTDEPPAARAPVAPDGPGSVAGPVPPAAVRLPGGGWSGVVPATIGARRTLQVPDDVSTVGWWRGGAGVASVTGALVLAAHVDTASQGPGPFARLVRLRPGQRVDVRGRDGRTRAYVVTGRRSHPRDRPLPASVFSGGAPHRLALITCTGTFDPDRRRYSETLVVHAVPA